jgi:hypothetical protein
MPNSCFCESSAFLFNIPKRRIAVFSSLTGAYLLQDYCRSLYRLSSLILRCCVAPQLLISYNEQVGSCILEPTLARQVFGKLDRN